MKKQHGSQTFIKGSDDLRIKRSMVLLLSCLLIVATLPMNVFAADGKYSSKDEVIYGKLDPNGNVKNMYVVNSFEVDEPGEFTDYGKYSNVRNLTDLTTIDQQNNKVSFEAEADFHYQGELEKKQLPWDISITYKLDGKEMKPEDLLEKSGDLEIQIETTANKEIDQTFVDYYMLQIGVMFDPKKFKNIQAPEATEANEGKNKLLNFTVLPEQEEVFIISAEVVDLEMEPIDISAVPASIGFDSPDTDELAEEMEELADAIEEINKGIGDLSTGVADLRGGANALSDGSNEFQSGLTELNNSSGQLIDGSQEILNAFRDISGGMADAPEVPDLSEIEAIPEGLREAAKELHNLNDGLGALEDSIKDIPSGTIGEDDFNELYGFLDENEANEDIRKVIGELQATYTAAQKVKAISEEIPVSITNVNNSMAKTLEEIADGIESAMEDLTLLDEVAELQDGLTTMASEYETFHNGLVTYTNGVSELATNYNELNNGTNDLANGVLDLEDGVKTLHDGTKELQDSTSDLPDQFQSEIDEFIDDFDFSDYKPVSFVSDKNENVSVVQFVLQTEGIQKDDDEDDEPVTEEESKTLWQRFLDLFR